jgi:hypothetical protein
MSRTILRLAREPLLHFLIIGAALFLVLGQGHPSQTGSEIFVSSEDMAHIAAGFSSTWQRPPSADELKGAVTDYVREEVLYRAGIDLGLDKDDTIVRRRVGQKMEFFIEGSVGAPTENDLQQYVDQYPEKFRSEPRIAFRQIYISLKREDAKQDAEALLPKLVSEGPNAPDLGDAILLPETFELTPVSEIASHFGAEFADAVSAAPLNTWSGPIKSAYGYHLVLVTAQEPGRLPKLADARSAVQREWYAQALKSAVDAKYDELRKRYVVRIDDGISVP